MTYGEQLQKEAELYALPKLRRTHFARLWKHYGNGPRLDYALGNDGYNVQRFGFAVLSYLPAFHVFFELHSYAGFVNGWQRYQRTINA